jgi:hypothetical protein
MDGNGKGYGKRGEWKFNSLHQPDEEVCVNLLPFLTDSTMVESLDALREKERDEMI